MSYTNIRTAMGENTVDNAYYARSHEVRDYDPEYEKLPMWDQLGKILDSQDNLFPRDDVTCDDEVVIDGVTPRDCMDIRNLALQFEKTETRLEFLKRIQLSKNLEEILDYVRSNR